MMRMIKSGVICVMFLLGIQVDLSALLSQEEVCNEQTTLSIDLRLLSCLLFINMTPMTPIIICSFSLSRLNLLPLQCYCDVILEGSDS